jgi:membrane-associated protein
MNIEHILEIISQHGIWAVYSALFGVIFAESGLLIGFFLPGDSLLFTTGFLAQKGIFGLNIYVLMVGYFLAAVLGDNVGYSFGKKFGKKLFNKKDSMLFHKDNLKKAQDFYTKHGRKTIILARFVPIVRTFAPIVAGMGDMHYTTFLAFNIIGGLLWAVGLPLAGFFLGGLIPGSEKYLEFIIIGIVLLSLLPTFYHVAKDKESRDGLKKIAHHAIKKVRRS